MATPAFEEIAETFAFLDDWEDRYRHVIELGKAMPPMDPARDRAMICGSLAFNIDVKTVLEGFGLREGANSEPREFVVEKAFVGEGI